MPATAEAPPKTPRKPYFTSETARDAQKRGVATMRARTARAIVTNAFDVSKLENYGKLGDLVRSNMAVSILVQSAILRQQQPTQFKHLLGKGRKPGILDVCERLASAASTVFQWGKDGDTPMIINGSFTVIQNQAAAPAAITDSPAPVTEAEVIPNTSANSSTNA